MTQGTKQTVGITMVTIYRSALVVLGFMLQDAFVGLREEIKGLRSDNRILSLTIAVEQRQNDINTKEIGWLKEQHAKLQEAVYRNHPKRNSL